MVRAKFKCREVTTYSGTQMVKYRFTAVCADEIEENKRYHRYTPSGELFISVDNPNVSFTAGKDYYLDFSEAV